MRRTKRKNTDDLLAQEKRAAAKSVLLYTLLQLLSAAALLCLRTLTRSGLLSHVLLALAVLDLLLVPFSFAALYQRVREIERDELDEARKY